MARGRMIAKKISLNKRVNDMSDRAQLMYTWAISHADRHGIIHGDPDVLKATVFPRRPDIDTESVEGYVGEWVGAGLIERYECEDDVWISFKGFVANQLGLRVDREPDSGYPEPPAEVCRKFAGSLPEDIPPKRSEVKRREEKQTSDFEEFWSFYPKKERKAETKDLYESATGSHEEHLSAVKAYAAIIERDQPEKRYIMLPTTFFRKGRWLDYVGMKVGNNGLGGEHAVWFCHRCGKENQHTGGFCLDCGVDKQTDGWEEEEK